MGSFSETYNDSKSSLPLFYPEHKYCGDDGAQNQKKILKDQVATIVLNVFSVVKRE